MPLVTLLTDFGSAEPYAGAVRGVLLAQCPGVTLADISHEIPAHDVLAGAFVLAAAAPWFPGGTVHLAVVDPGVGGPRRAIVASAGGQLFVGPDNGLFTFVIARDGGASVREIDPAGLGLAPPSATFHGRDLFAPVAARLAAGLPFASVGPPVGDPVRLEIPPARRDGAVLRLHVLHVDRFGNVVTSLERSDAPRLADGGMPRAWRRREPDGPRLEQVSTFGEGPPDRAFALWGSSGYLELAADRRSAAAMLGLAAGDALCLEPLG